MKAPIHSTPILPAPPKKRFLLSISLTTIAILGLMTTNAWSQHTWDVNVNVVNSAETPVMLSLGNNGNAKATFPNGANSFILQPGQSTVLYAQTYTADSLQWNIIYNFYDGTDNINQRISSEGYMSGPNVNCASPSQSGMFSVSEGTYIDATFADFDVGNAMASWMGLHGTSEKVVGGLIDFFMDLAGYNPDQSETSNYYYSITIGQQDYNIDKLAGVGWDTGATPPPVTFIQGQQIHQYSQGNAWLSSEYSSNNATIAYIDGYAGNAYIGTKAGQILHYAISNGTPQLVSVATFSNNHPVVQLSVNPYSPQYIAAFGDSSIESYDGTTAPYILHDNSWGSGILQMIVNWMPDFPLPQILVGLADGRVEYFNGGAWAELQNNSWGSSIMKLSASWDYGDLQVVAGLGNGSILWWNGFGYPASWMSLGDSSWNNPVYQLDATFDPSGGNPPALLVGLFNGAINYRAPSYDASWADIKQADSNYCIVDVDADSTNGLRFLAGFRDGSVSLYESAAWHLMEPATSNRVQFLSADWGKFNPTNHIVPYVFCCNYQFTYDNWNNFPSNKFAYPAIPDNSGAVNLSDTLAVIGTNEYTSCTNLTSIRIGNSVTNIGSAAFSNCVSLAQIYFRGNAPSLGTNVFSGDNRATIYYMPGTTGWGSTFGGRPTALWSPRIRSGAHFGVNGNRFGFDIVWEKTSRMAVVVEACTNLANPAWSPLATNTLFGDTGHFSDAQWTSNLSRFYRLSLP